MTDERHTPGHRLMAYGPAGALCECGQMFETEDDHEIHALTSTVSLLVEALERLRKNGTHILDRHGVTTAYEDGHGAILNSAELGSLFIAVKNAELALARARGEG